MASSRPTPDVVKQTISLRELTTSFHRNKKSNRAIVDALHVHAPALSQSICNDFKALNAITLRHEALIRKIWTNKTVAQRRKILLAAWPDMPKEHRPDSCALTTLSVRRLKHSDGYIPDRLSWPYINQQDLVTARTFLIFLNSRGRKSPWEFAATEEEFYPAFVLAAGSCIDKCFCTTTKIEFTEAVDANTYGKIIMAADNHQSESTDKYDYCARRSFFVLLTQEKILAFLLACVRSILQDLSDDCLFSAPITDEPPISQIIINKSLDHVSFTDVLQLAPYRGWDSLNFTQLRGYVQSILTTHQSHIWAMREDPGYFADTIQEFLDHSPYAISSTCAPHLPHALAQLPGYDRQALDAILGESFALLSSWDLINTHLERHEQLVRDGASKQEQVGPILQLDKLVRHTGNRLLKIIYASSRAAPAVRSLILRDCCSAIYAHKYIYHSRITANEKEVLQLFDRFHCEDSESLVVHPAFLSFHIERIDRLLQTSATARRMISGCMMSLLTDVSVVTELLRQLRLWVRSPEVKTGRVDGCGCKMCVEEGEGITFNKWIAALEQDFRPPIDLVFPLREKLNYPEHKKRTPVTVAIMRQAEDHLDLFWAAVDVHFTEKTGTAYHSSVQRCLENNGKMYRTAPWPSDLPAKTKPAQKSAQEFQPIPNQLHDTTVQITGSFDKLDMVDKVKPKTRGSVLSSSEHPVVVPSQASSDSSGNIFIVNKASYKTLQVMFHVPADDIGELPRAIKWNDFKRAMVSVGFSAEKLQGSAWQFTPTKDVGAERSIQFHEPHPVSDIPYIMAKRFGRRLFRVYGWNGEIFRLA